MKKFWKFAMVFIIFFYLLLLVVFTLLNMEYRHLNEDDHLGKTSCIVAYMEQEDEDILKKAAEMKKKYKDAKIIYSPFVVNETKNSIKLMKQANFSKKDIIPDYYSTSKKSSAEETGKIMEAYKYETCLIVAHDYEMKHLLKTYSKANPHYEFFNASVKENGKDYLETAEGRKKAEQELIQLPKLWLNL